MQACVPNPEYLRRTPPMAVRAAHHALLDFRGQHFEACPGTAEVTHGPPLGASNVIEFQHFGIGDAAVDSRVFCDIRNNEGWVSRTIAGDAQATAFIESMDVPFRGIDARCRDDIPSTHYARALIAGRVRRIRIRPGQYRMVPHIRMIRT